MPELKAGKIVETTASLACYAQAGGGGTSTAEIRRYCEWFGVSFAPTNETKKKNQKNDRRRSQVYILDHRVNNGRGERLFDAIVQVPFLDQPLIGEVPVSFKAGDARDVSSDIKLLQAVAASGMPVWVYLLQGQAQSVWYENDVRMDIPPATGITMRRVNLTPIIRDFLETWEAVDGEGLVTFVRRFPSNGYEYTRLRVNWNRVPGRYWLDPEPRPFDPTAPLPSPYL